MRVRNRLSSWLLSCSSWSSDFEGVGVEVREWFCGEWVRIDWFFGVERWVVLGFESMV